MNKTLEQPTKPIQLDSRYWLRLLLATIFSLLVAFAGTITWVRYTQTMDYLHPARQTPSGGVLQANGIEYQEIELFTEDNIKLSAWYTPPKNGSIILTAHGYGDKRTEDFHALFASHGYGVLAWAPGAAPMAEVKGSFRR